LNGGTGPDGLNGVTGPTGQRGPTGQAGFVGPSGPAGTPGVTGPTGADGVNGVDTPGAPGSVGPTGPAGSVGPTGPALDRTLTDLTSMPGNYIAGTPRMRIKVPAGQLSASITLSNPLIIPTCMIIWSKVSGGVPLDPVVGSGFALVEIQGSHSDTIIDYLIIS